MAHSVDSLGVAVDTLAAMQADHSDRISSLESAPSGPSEAASQPRTFVIGAQGVVIGEMRYVGSWDAFKPFLTQDVVRFAKATWACISPVSEPTFKLGPIPAALLAKITNGKPLLGAEEPAEVKEDVIEITDPTFTRTAVYLGQCKVYEILGNGKKSVITNPNSPASPAGAFVHTYVFNSLGEEKQFESWAGGAATIETEVLGAGEKFFLVYQMTAKAGGEGAEPNTNSTVPRTILVKATETKAFESGNKPPSEDSGHWVKIAEAAPEAAGVSISAPIAPNTPRAAKTNVEVSATKQGMVALRFRAEKGKEALILVKVGAVVVVEELKIGNQATEAADQDVVVTFPIAAGKAYQWEAGVGEVKEVKSTHWTLN